MTYQIPEEYKTRFTDEFFKYFLDKLSEVFKHHQDRESSYFVEQCESTQGWGYAFTSACKVFKLEDILEYYDALNWDESDWFDSGITDIAKEKGIL